MRAGIDLGGTFIKAGLVDDSLCIVAKGSRETKVGRHYSEIIADMAQLISELCAQVGIAESEIESIGIGSPGVADINAGVLVFSNNLNWHDVPVAAELKRYFDAPVYLDNDANCAALGEAAAGAAKDYGSSVMITLGTGVGGGIIDGGKVLRGFNGAGGEIGHMVIAVGGEKCSCGRSGCYERYASTAALVRMAEQRAKQEPNSLLYRYLAEGNLNGRTIVDAAQQNDTAAEEILDSYRKYVAIGIANIISILQPEAVVIGGGISAAGEFLLGGIREYTYEQLYSDKLARTVIVKATLGNDAGIVGASQLGRKL